MGALATAVIARIPLQTLSDLTNPQNKPATPAVNATQLANAEADAIADFGQISSVTFDPTVASHISIGIWGVLAKLYQFRGVNSEDPNANWAIAQWNKGLETFKRNGGNMDWVPPTFVATQSNGWSAPKFLGDMTPNRPGTERGSGGFTPPTYFP